MPNRVVDERTRLHWWRYLGPWPLSPVAAALMMWMSAAFYEIARITASEVAPNLALLPPALIAGVPAGVAAAGVLWLFSRWSHGGTPPAWRYWLAILTTAVVFVGIRFALGILPTEGFGSNESAIFAGFVRSTLVLVFIQAVTGVTGHRLAAQVDKTNAALELVREQQELMVEADEQRRAQVSRLLHDRVQAGLIAACLELQDCAERAEPGLRQEISDVVHRLEEVRGLDVRRAARTLSPDLADTDLHSAIDDLAAQYSPSMRVDVKVAPPVVAYATRPPRQLLLGAYRIIEQSLLNAAIHGRARNCVVDVALRDGDLVVTVDDDGRGFTNVAPSGGLGTALVTTWVRILDGEWARTVSPLGGVRVKAELPYASS